MSGNTIGSVFWSDGKRESPMLPPTLTVGACPHCSAALFLDRLKTYQEGGEAKHGLRFDMGPIEGAEEVREADTATFLVLLRRSRSPARCFDLRLGLWWYLNNAVRPQQMETTDARSPWRPEDAIGGPIFRENLTALLALLADRPEPEMRLFAAEARRELGDFDGAIAELAEDLGEDLAQPAERLRELATAQNDRVEVLFGDG